MGVTRLHYHKALAVAEHLGSSMDGREVRARAGAELLSFLRADYFASFVWDRQTGSFSDPVAINIDPGNIQCYCSYFQYHNPITGKVRDMGRAVRINEVLPQRELMRTEFYHDFLARGGLYYGLNLYVRDAQQNFVDIRIWRSRRRANFARLDVQLLELIKPHFRNAMANILAERRSRAAMDDPGKGRPGCAVERLQARFGLSPRQLQVAAGIADGKTDQQIAAELAISFSTIRTHVNHLFERTGARNRAALVRLISVDD